MDECKSLTRGVIAGGLFANQKLTNGVYGTGDDDTFNTSEYYGAFMAGVYTLEYRTQIHVHSRIANDEYPFGSVCIRPDTLEYWAHSELIRPEPTNVTHARFSFALSPPSVYPWFVTHSPCHARVYAPASWAAAALSSACRSSACW